MATSLAITEKELYNYNQTILKVYGSGNSRKIKLVNIHKLKKAGYELAFEFENKKIENTFTHHETKLDESISRTRTTIFDLAYCNDWQYFSTITIDGANYSRDNLTEFRKDFSQFIRNFNRLNKCSIKYLLVPELHKDKESWHLHGFFMGLPENLLYKFTIKDFIPYKILNKLKNR